MVSLTGSGREQTPVYCTSIRFQRKHPERRSDLERNPMENRLYARGWGDTWCVLARKSEWKEDLRTIERRFFQCGGIVRACPRKQWRIRYPLREGPKSLSRGVPNTGSLADSDGGGREPPLGVEGLS